MLADKGRDKVVAVIVAGLHAQFERVLMSRACFPQQLGFQLFGQKLIRVSLVDQHFGPGGSDLDVLELTLSLQGRYAGRFKIGKGNDRPQLEGSYTVREKMIGPTYYGRDGAVASNDPNNPLGKHWIGLENRVGIHGTNDPNNVGTVDGRGSVCLGDRDVEDVFDILTVDSRVIIRR